MIIINTKNYKTGNELLKFAKRIESYDIHTIVAVPATDIATLTSKTSLNVYAQHVDARDTKKASTGFVTSPMVSAQGATGTLINHSEHPLPREAIRKVIMQCKENHMVSVVCVKNIAEARYIAQYKPSAIALEETTLIGTGKSITTSKGALISTFVKTLKGKPIVPLCGAGISSVQDVKRAYSLGCKGVIIASALANTKTPERFLEGLAKWQRSLE